MDGIIIQARTGSTRLANKTILPFYKEERIIDILINNLAQSYPDFGIVLATTDRPQDDILAQIAEEKKIKCFRGDEDNVLNRFIRTAETFGIERFIRVCSDNPFLQVASFETLFTLHNSCQADYVSFGFANGTPSIKTHLGLFSELTTLHALRRVAEMTSEKLYLEHVTNYLYTHPTVFSTELLPLPGYLEGRFDLRFTLDTMEDFALLQELYATFKEATDQTIESLLSLVEKTPCYREKMILNIQKNTK